MNYWGMNINTWEEFYPRDGVTSPSYKNEWERYNRKEVADFLNWQCDLVNEYKRKDQFVTHCFMPDDCRMLCISFQHLAEIRSQ